MTTITQRTYYAAHYPYGVATDSNTGRLVRTFLRFETRAERDRWVENRPTDSRRSSGYREAVPASEADLRRELAQESGAMVRWADEAGW